MAAVVIGLATAVVTGYLGQAAVGMVVFGAGALCYGLWYR